jgi:hypothetical protein
VRVRRRSPVFEAALFWLLLLPAGLPSQTPKKTGKLIVTSTPQGATIVINGQKVPQPTNATFVVSAGTYRVSVADAEGKLKNCATKVFSVSSGSQTTAYCTATGWTAPPK